MGQSYRIRTTPGDDKNIVIQVNQDFEELEILSLKVRQQDVYTRMCSDYGVVAGRVFSNKGYGIPNVKVSIFVPLLAEDEDNPVITSLYPYKNLEQTNEDGYRYNLLPYYPSYPDHNPTGTFPSRIDNLINQTVVELYDKYYKYTVTTNDAGDFLIFGVPTGTQTIVMNVDLSDIGEFSLSPQDLIRMGIATESQFDGVKFKSSPNFELLPQIIVLNKTIEIVPFWGEEDICRIGISRCDFDLTAEANLDIKPVSVFMGSLMSSNEKTGIKANGRAKKRTGELCGMFAGPGEILAISQTLFRDSDGLPILELANLPNGGKLIDADGTWLFDLSMNLDYVYTNEFGCKVLSDDPKIGIPTKGKYRFKVKWQQSKNLNEDYKRGYFLVPNIKEKGWDANYPNVDPLTGVLGSGPFYAAQSSYAFSLSWSAYTLPYLPTVTLPDVVSAINCEDYFYEFDYNKVYTVSQLLDQDKRRNNRKRYLGIKRINDDTCENTANKYPVNDANYNPTLIMFMFVIIINVLGTIMKPFLIIYHVLAFIVNLIYDVIIWVLCGLASICLAKVCPFGWLRPANCDGDRLLKELRLPMINYPDCQVCDCELGDADEDSYALPQIQFQAGTTPNGIKSTSSNQAFVPFLLQNHESNAYPYGTYRYSPQYPINEMFSGLGTVDRTPVNLLLNGLRNSVTSSVLNYRTNDLNFGERINAFNTKGKYYDDNGGNTQVSVQYDPTGNTSSHLDNVLVFVMNYDSGAGFSDRFSAGTIITFVQPEKSIDPNITGNTRNYWKTYATVGNMIYPNSLTIEYADPSSRVSNLSTTYVLPTLPSPYTASTLDLSAQTYFQGRGTYGFASDIEYFQVVKMYPLEGFINNSKNYPSSGSFADIVKGKFYIYREDNSTANGYRLATSNMTDVFTSAGYMVLVVQRGVDPYSHQYNTKVGLGKLFGYDNHNDITETVPLRLNIPVKNTTSSGDKMMYEMINSSNNATPNNGLNISYPSYVFTPDSGSYKPYTSSLLSFYSSLDSCANSNSGVFNNVQDVRPSTNNNALKFFTTLPPNGDYDGKIFFLNKSQTQGPYKRLDINEGSTNATSTSQNVTGYQTSGNLVVGERYIQIQAGGDFSNVANVLQGSINQVGCVFIATGVNPTSWGISPNPIARICKLVVVESFLTPTDCPNRDKIPAGDWKLTMSAFITNTSETVKIGFEVYKRDSSGTETKLPFSYNFIDVTNLLSPTPTYTDIINSCPDIPILKTDSILLKVIAYNPFVSTSRSLKVFFDGSTAYFPASYIVTSFIREDAKYSDDESLMGGTYAFLDNIQNKTYYSPAYSSINYNMSDYTRLIIRSDRLPQTDTPNSENLGSGNQAIFQQNNIGYLYFPNMKPQTSINQSTFTPQENKDIDPSYTADTTGLDSSVLNSFGCNGLRPLDCYHNVGLAMTIDPNCLPDTIENGCYVFVRDPIVDLLDDIYYFNEYLYRFKFLYKLCQGLIGDAFINNWVNGNLYAFPFKVNTFYNKGNKVKKRKFPKHLVMIHYESNNFYYRSSPYDVTTNNFIGAPGGPVKGTSVNISNGANQRNLRFPTTILNMGPKVSFLKDITLGPQFLGYYMDKQHSTSYNDLDDIVNFFAITRMTSPGFFGLVKTANTTKALFSRPGNKVDGDYAQSVAINTQFGVVPLDGEFYTSAPPNPDVICAGLGSDQAMMGVFFDSSDEDIQFRDYVSPVREIRYNPTNGVFAYDNIGTKSQVVPNYKWNVDTGGQTIFGTQQNNWSTNIGDILAIKYQGYDRLASLYHTGNAPTDFDKRGYIFGMNIEPTVQTGGTLVSGLEYIISDYNSGDDFTNVGASSNATGILFTATGTVPSVWSGGSTLQYRGDYQTGPGALQPNPALVGAPWYFYFGLVKGSTALNRFFDKYVGLAIDE